MRKKIIPPSAPPGPIQKTSLQLEQWAAYEKITAERAAIKAAEDEAHHEIAVFQGGLLSEAKRWAAAENIRAYVREVLRLALLP